MSWVSEVAREREVLKFAPDLFENSRDHSAWAASKDPESDSQFGASSSPDLILTALAQLVALKLNVARCLISVFDRKRQHVIAEATQNSPLVTNQNQDDLWLGGFAIPRSHGICEHILFPEEDGEPWASPEAGLRASVVPDLAEDIRFCARSFVRKPPYNRFYAGIPICSPKDIIIGALCVFDDQPRANLGDGQIEIMRSISQAVTNHLESRRSAGRLRRDERMVRGLGSFVEGRSTMSGWHTNADPSSFRDNGSEGNLNIKQQLIQQQTQHRDFIYDEDIHQQTQHHDFGYDDDQSAATRPEPIPLQPRPEVASEIGGDMNGPGYSKGVNTAATATAMVSTTSITSIGTAKSESFSQDPRNGAVRDICGRAANIIREGVEIEGALFLDASISSFGGLVLESEAYNSDSNSPAAGTASSDSQDDTAEPEGGFEMETCKILGYSTSDDSSIDDGAKESGKARIPTKILGSLLRRYASGTVFSFDDDGTVHSEDEDSIQVEAAEPEHPTSPKRPTKIPRCRSKEAKCIIDLFPGARCVALVPLWDSQKDRWFAGSFIWTKKAGRVFTVENELSYLRAFGNTIMAEITRLDTKIAEKAKSDLLGSLSHELRSPLHGIIAAIELLQDTELSPIQTDIVHSMESCGRTLLDVVEHLLDYSKMNQLAKSSKRQKQDKHPRKGISHRQRSFQSHITALSTTVEVDALAEETVQSIFAGHTFQRMPSERFARYKATQVRDGSDSPTSDLTGRPGDESLLLGVDTVMVYLDIDPKVSWFCHTPAGALRRIIMNLVGNSLKYTERGYIRVSLEQEKIRAKASGSSSRLRLTVSDSGKGISAEYLQNDVFTPFSQEDPLSSGTGLGLSLVHQITTMLGGSVQIDSKVNRGTSVVVILPLQAPDTQAMRDTAFPSNLAVLKGLRISNCSERNQVEAPSTSSIPEESSFVERNSLETLCREWLHLDMVAAGSPDIRPDVILCTDSTMNAALSLHEGHVLPPVIVISRDAFVAHSLSLQHGNSGSEYTFEFISQPAGPRKLARAMVRALARYNDFRAAELSVIDVPAPASHIPADKLAPQVAIPEQRPSSTAGPAEAFPPTASPEPSGQVKQEDANLTSSEDEMTRMAQELAEVQICDQYLLVDDNNINLKILMAFMKKMKLQYTIATNGLEAFEAYAANPTAYASILMDISMPIMDGLEATRRIRELEHRQQLRPAVIIALTGLASAKVQKEAFTSGVDLFLTKPVRLNKLAEVLGQVQISKTKEGQ